MSHPSVSRAALAAALAGLAVGSLQEVSAEQIDLGGPIEVYHNGQLVELVPNIVPAAMRSYILKAAYAGGAQYNTWYIAPFSNAVTPGDGLTAANFNSTLAEFTNYVEADRPTWAQDAEAAQAIANATTMAEITCGAGGGVVNGIVLISVPTKGSGAGLIAAATRFTNPRNLQETDTLWFRYTMQANLPAG